MRKWVLAIVSAALVVAFARWGQRRSSSAYVNGLDAYADIPNRQYIFERPCYIFKLKGRDTDFPLVGDHAVAPELPAEVDRRYIGADLPGARILDVVGVGDRFRIASVRRDEIDGRFSITFEILFLNEGEWKYPRLDTYWIMDHSPESRGAAPALLPAYAVERPQN